MFFCDVIICYQIHNDKKYTILKIVMRYLCFTIFILYFLKVNMMDHGYLYLYNYL